MNRLFLVLILLVIAVHAGAQENLPSANIFEQAARQITEEKDTEERSSNPVFCDELCQELRIEYLKAQVEEIKMVTRLRQRAFDWHHTTTVLIFWLVNLIVVSGLIFSGVQFFKQGGDKDNDDSHTNFKISLSGLEASSKGIGLLIFILSIAFFYLYLIYVYPVNELS